VIFPAVITVRDVTVNLFRYVLGNLIRTRHYGAQTTRTGAMVNHILAVVLTDGEIFSNLKFTQRLYDTLKTQVAVQSPDPVNVPAALAAAQKVVPDLLREDRVVLHQLVEGADLRGLLVEARSETQDHARQTLQAALNDSQAYHARWIEKKK
jgi:CRISPR-associated protein Csc2